jgi:hypothetical protein
MSTVTSDTISASLNLAGLSFGHPWKEVHIGPIQNMTIDGRGQRYTLYELQGDTTNPSARMFASTADLTINDAQNFHGAVELGAFASVELVGVGATSYSFDPTHDLLKLYKGNHVVDTLALVEPGNTTGVLQVQSSTFASGWTLISTGYTGLSYGIGQHV